MGTMGFRLHSTTSTCRCFLGCHTGVSVNITEVHRAPPYLLAFTHLSRTPRSQPTRPRPYQAQELQRCVKQNYCPSSKIFSLPFGRSDLWEPKYFFYHLIQPGS